MGMHSTLSAHVAGTTIVTTFSPKNWKEYASRTLPTWFAHFGESVEFHLHCDWEPICYRRVTWCRDSPQKTQFFLRNTQLNRICSFASKGYVTRWDTYCHKVFAQCESALAARTRFLLFLDADVAVVKDVPDGYLASLLNGAFCGYLERSGFVTETGFILYDLTRDPGREFFKSFLDVYLSDALFDFTDGWDDCHVFDRCRAASPLPFVSLSGTHADALDPIAMGPLGEYFDHWIGRISKEQRTSKFRQFRSVGA